MKKIEATKNKMAKIKQLLDELNMSAVTGGLPLTEYGAFLVGLERHMPIYYTISKKNKGGKK